MATSVLDIDLYVFHFRSSAGTRLTPGCWWVSTHELLASGFLYLCWNKEFNLSIPPARHL